ncbi:hypothetical protein GMST_36590 [Geomonas silvestris]|uniref:DUF2029 domain-containing protein n=1 Tax=Geomonas silvestris TaxID=2740184 RepID=A0A6V8MN26_9BACT|nr:hypothetical protein GMST_36590 [Geomonas silvestris]
MPALLLCAAGFLALRPELRLAVPELIGITAAMVLALSFALYRGGRGGIGWSPRCIILIALVLRLMFLASPPQLSDDLYRYLWDGSNILRGINPYQAAPARTVPPASLKAAHALINHPEYVTIYPPTAQLVFAAGATLGGLTGLKALLVLFDLALCGLIVVLLRQLTLPPWLAVLYAWNPLPVLEIAGSGHVDGAGLSLLVAALVLTLRGAPRETSEAPRRGPAQAAGLLFAAACLVKLFPLPLTPVLFLLTPRVRRLEFSLGCATGLAALTLPFWPELAHITQSLDAYARNWEFAGFAYNTLRTATGSGTTARLTLSLIFACCLMVLVGKLAMELKRAESPAERGRAALTACYRITLALLLTTPTLQPWYALSLAALFPMSAGPAGLVLCWAVFLTYQVQIPYFVLGKWIESPAVTAALFLAPLLAWLLARMSGGRTARG